MRNQSVIKYLLDMQERLRRSAELANEKAIKERARTKKWYDKSSRKRALVEGQKVLILLPSNSNKLMTSWEGPFTVYSGDRGIEPRTLQTNSRVCNR